MDSSTLQKSNELAEIINKTRQALENLKKLKAGIRDEKENRHYDDRLYSLHISQYEDGSGNPVELSRYMGNMELINAIIETLERQLKDFEEEFRRL